MKVTIEGKEYEIDVEKAKELGVIKEDSIKSFKVGDVFSIGHTNLILIVQNGWPRHGHRRYNIAGLDGLCLYSNFGDRGASKEEMLAYLNENCKFIKNVNSEIKKLLQSL